MNILTPLMEPWELGKGIADARYDRMLNKTDPWKVVGILVVSVAVGLYLFAQPLNTIGVVLLLGELWSVSLEQATESADAVHWADSTSAGVFWGALTALLALAIPRWVSLGCLVLCVLAIVYAGRRWELRYRRAHPERNEDWRFQA